jgi:hypothetical protein
MNKGFSYYFCLMTKGSGSIPLTCGSGSGKPKNMWIRWEREKKTDNSRYQYLNQKQYSYKCFASHSSSYADAISDSQYPSLSETDEFTEKRVLFLLPNKTSSSCKWKTIRSRSYQQWIRNIFCKNILIWLLCLQVLQVLRILFLSMRNFSLLEVRTRFSTIKECGHTTDPERIGATREYRYWKI